MPLTASRNRDTLRATDRPSVTSGGGRKGDRKGTGGARRSRAKRKTRRRGRWSRIFLWTLILLLAGPALVLLLYRVVPPPGTSLMAIRALEGAGTDYRWTPLERISPHLARAVIAAEDNRFCAHWGVDLGQIEAAIRDWRDGEGLRGASTISMQTVKNVLLWPRSHLPRKLAEAWLTPQLELIWPKRRILEVYLNVAEMGPGIYGAEAAAQRYFGKSAAALEPREAALIAAALPNPRRAQPAQPSDYLVKRAEAIETRITQLGPLLACAP